MSADEMPPEGLQKLSLAQYREAVAKLQAMQRQGRELVAVAKRPRFGGNRAERRRQLAVWRQQQRGIS